MTATDTIHQILSGSEKRAEAASKGPWKKGHYDFETIAIYDPDSNIVATVSPPPPI